MLDSFKRTPNAFLLMAGILSLVAALIHIGIMLGGADWYRFFGAGEEMAVMSEQGSWVPPMVTLFIGGVLFLWGCYAFSGAKIMPRMPFIKTALLLISAIYVVRGLMILPLWLGWLEHTEQSSGFWFWSSVICLIYGFFYAVGTYRYLQEDKP